MTTSAAVSSPRAAETSSMASVQTERRRSSENVRPMQAAACATRRAFSNRSSRAISEILQRRRNLEEDGAS